MAGRTFYHRRCVIDCNCNQLNVP